MTGSKVQRPAATPASRPATLPATRPASKPSALPATRPSSRPPIAKPTTRPSVTKPTQLPGNRPGLERPTTLPGNKPGLDRPTTLPGNKPGLERPTTLPGNKPGLDRPTTLPGNKPGLDRPTTLPGNKPGFERPTTLPGTRPGPLPTRPGANRPSTLPGMVTYPNRPGGNNRPGGINNINRPNVDIGNVNIGGHNNGLARPSTLPARKPNWNNNQWGGNRGVWGNNNRVNIGNNVNVNINNRFYNNNNFAYRPNYWGARPWWGAGASHSWHSGHWGYGYNRAWYGNHWYFHDDHDFAQGFMWGIAVWSLGNMIYDMGYNSYRNPYPAPAVVYYPVPSATDGGAKSTIDYSQPVSVTAAANPPGDEAATTLAETKSNEALEQSRSAFKQGDYVAALKSCEEAIAYTPGDATLHEYRALVLFALGRYSDAAGVLNPVLASGPGWGWDTMAGFYDATTTYNAQLRKLETYVKGKPDAADARFLLGYHYMVCDNLGQAYAQFDRVVQLQPADTISRQLRDLTKSSLPDSEEAEGPPPVRPTPVPGEKLVGTWISDRGQDGKVTFTMSKDGNYTWSYMNGDKTSDLKGTYGLDDKGLLVLTTEDSQMVSEVTLSNDKQMKFVLVGAPEGDPGLDFKKS
jgi:hypothetical protein